VPERRFSSLSDPQEEPADCPIRALGCSREPNAAKRGAEIRPHQNCRSSDEAVKEPASRAQVRIRWRHLQCGATRPEQKIFFARKVGPANCGRAPGSGSPELPSAYKSALGSRSCGRCCPALRLTPKSRMIESRVRKRCVNSMSSAVSPPLARRRGARAERTAEFLQSPRNRAKTDGAAERSTRFRGGLESTWTDFVCGSHPDFVQRAHLRAARGRLTPGRASISKHACSNTAHFLRGMA